MYVCSDWVPASLLDMGVSINRTNRSCLIHCILSLEETMVPRKGGGGGGEHISVGILSRVQNYPMEQHDCRQTHS